MKKIVFVCLVMAFNLTNVHAQNRNTAFDFKNIKLGMKYSEFISMPIPETSTFSMGVASESFLVCSDDPRVSAFSRTDSAEKKFSGINCEFGYTSTLHPKVPPSYRIASLVVGGYTSDTYSFKFIKGPNDSEPILYEIFFLIHINAFPSVSLGLMEKFGKPKTTNSSVMSKLGASFPNTVLTWENSVSAIKYEKRFTDLETSQLIYELKTHKKIILNERANLNKGSM